jgi:hypothetical protein
VLVVINGVLLPHPHREFTVTSDPEYVRLMLVPDFKSESPILFCNSAINSFHLVRFSKSQFSAINQFQARTNHNEPQNTRNVIISLLKIFFIFFFIK